MIRAIVLGATGMVGEGVLHEALLHSEVEKVLALTRRPVGRSHPKLEELIVPDLSDLTSIRSRLTGYDACYFCLGVSSIGMTEADYTRTTYDLTMSVARTLLPQNPGMTFCYVSGEGTDETERGRSMWARVKGRTENDLLAMPFKAAFMFRPGFIRPTIGLKNAYSISKVVGVIYPLIRGMLAAHLCTLEDLGRAMINATLHGAPKKVLENKDIAALAAFRTAGKHIRA